MATVNFSVPERVKQQFNKIFSGKNKSQVIARLMMQAVEEERLRQRRQKLIDALLKLRQKETSFSDIKLREARVFGRP